VEREEADMWLNPLYLPEHPHARAKQLVDRNPLSTVISTDPVHVAHMPMLWRRDRRLRARS